MPILKALVTVASFFVLLQLADWWLDTAYLTYRDPVVVYSSPGIVWPKQDFKEKDDQLEFASRILDGILDYKAILDKGCLPVEMMGKSPMDMGQYYKIFGTSRMPGKDKDSLSVNFNSKHIVVIHNNNVSGSTQRKPFAIQSDSGMSFDHRISFLVL